MALPSSTDTRVSVVKRGSIVIHENVVRIRKSEFVYRLTVEPRGFVRENEKKQFYSLSVAVSESPSRRAFLRDFTSDRDTADRLYHLICIGGVAPEHLEDIYADFMAT
jgi:hypothetical protein